MGDSGLRREEAASARREHLRPSSYGTSERPVWELTIVGKGQRERTVPVSAATLNALRAHWLDRAQDFDGATEDDKQSGPLLCPIVIPRTDASRRRHRGGQSGESGEGQLANEAGYTADGLNRLISRMVTELVETMDGLSLDERVRLGRSNAHAFRHYVRRRTISGERAKPHFRLVIVSVMTGAPIRSPDINPATLQPVQKSEQVVGRVETPRFAV
jgi:integrase